MKKINWNELTPVCYSIAKHEDKDIGVAARYACPPTSAPATVSHAGSYALGPKYTPDYKALKPSGTIAPTRNARVSATTSTTGSRPCGISTRSSARSGPTSTRASISGAA